MNRKDFFKKLGVVIVTSIITPPVLFSKNEDNKKDKKHDEHRLYLDANSYFTTKESFQRNDVIAFGEGDVYVVTRESDGWYFLEKQK